MAKFCIWWVLHLVAFKYTELHLWWWLWFKSLKLQLSIHLLLRCPLYASKVIRHTCAIQIWWWWWWWWWWLLLLLLWLWLLWLLWSFLAYFISHVFTAQLRRCRQWCRQGVEVDGWFGHQRDVWVKPQWSLRVCGQSWRITLLLARCLQCFAVFLFW